MSTIRISAAVALLTVLLAKTAPAQTNYDEAAVGAVSLPALLPPGAEAHTKSYWEKTRRNEILRLFRAHVYGAMPAAPKKWKAVTLSSYAGALDGLATRKQVRVFFGKPADSAFMDILLYLPNNATGPVPVFIGLNYFGNQSVAADTGIIISRRWMMPNEKFGVVGNRATERTRGVHASRWPVETLLRRGYGVATAYYGDLEPDHANGWKTGIRSSLRNVTATRPEEWGAIGAWAWGLSRILDYLRTEPRADANGVIVTGHSRLGKAALWAAANDQRFAMAVSNNSGEGGAALARRNYGETVADITRSFPHWFIPAYATCAGNIAALPVDQHMLLALVAPRPLYVASAADDRWADPRGEFLSLKFAEPAYALYGIDGLPQSEMPPIDHPVGRTMRYHIRTGGHDITFADWTEFMSAADTLILDLP